MIIPLKYRVAFKTLAVVTAGVFLWNQLAWARGFLDETLERQREEQAQRYSPSYLKTQQQNQEGLITQKQTTEDFLNGQVLSPTSDTRSPDEVNPDLTGPQGGGEETIAPQPMEANEADGGEPETPQASANFTVTTEIGDTLYYEGNKLNKIVKENGTVIRNIVLDEGNNLLDAEIAYTDGTLQLVIGAKTVKITKPDGTIINYGPDERIKSILYPDGTPINYSYILDRNGNVTQTIVSDSEKTSYYNSNNRLTYVKFHKGLKSAAYNDGVLARATDEKGRTYNYSTTRVINRGNTEYIVRVAYNYPNTDASTSTSTSTSTYTDTDTDPDVDTGYEDKNNPYLSTFVYDGDRQLKKSVTLTARLLNIRTGFHMT